MNLWPECWSCVDDVCMCLLKKKNIGNTVKCTCHTVFKFCAALAMQYRGWKCLDDCPRLKILFAVNLKC